MDKHTKLDENDPSGSMFDRVWSCTRPAELSESVFDEIWAQVQRQYQDPNVLGLASQRSSGRIWSLVPFALAAAAAIFAAAVLMPRPIGPKGPGLVQNTETLPPQTPLVSQPFDLEPFETLVIEINGNVVRDRRFEPEAKTAIALNDIPATAASDILNWMEAHSND